MSLWIGNSCTLAVYYKSSPCTINCCSCGLHLPCMRVLTMIATTAWVLVLLYFCSGSVTSANHIRGSSSSSSDYYTPPVCGNNKFYCPGSSQTYQCVARSERCTGDAQSNMCRMKTYEYCNYDMKTGKFEVWRYSTNLQSSFSGRKRLSLEHQFIVYRGFMYEFGRYGTRVQDPNDPKYEYGPGRRASRNPKRLGLSSCTYGQVMEFVTIWSKNPYKLFSRNCQHFVKGLGAYLTDNCSRAPSRRQKSQSKEDFARYIFSIAGTNCTNSSTPSTSAESSASRSTVPLQLVAFIAVGMLAFMLSVVWTLYLPIYL